MYIIIHLFIRENYGSVVYKGKAFVISIPFIFELHSFLIQITQIGFPSQILFSPSHLFFQFNNRLPLSSHSLCPSPFGLFVWVFLCSSILQKVDFGIIIMHESYLSLSLSLYIYIYKSKLHLNF